jgi:hypothetical protein
MNVYVPARRPYRGVRIARSEITMGVARAWNLLSRKSSLTHRAPGETMELMPPQSRLLVCPKCACHAKLSEERCPCCGSRVRGNDPWIAPAAAVVAMGLTVVTCSDETGGAGGGGGGDTMSQNTSSAIAGYTHAISVNSSSSGAGEGGAGGAGGEETGGGGAAGGAGGEGGAGGK